MYSNDISRLPTRVPQQLFWLLGLAALLGGLVYIGTQTSARMAGLWAVGGALGFVLFHASYGFTGAYRACITAGRSVGVRAQLLMLAVAVLLFFPALQLGEVFGQPVRGFVFAAGWAVVIGAFLFGIGMQLAGGCGSGTLYAVGGGDARAVVVLAFFVVGMTLGAWDSERWDGLAALPAISLPQSLGLWPALALNLAVFAGLAWLLARREQRLTGRIEPLLRAPKSQFLTGPWALVWGAVALALLNFATLLLAGRPWGLTQAFVTWGSRLAEGWGWADPVFWTYWDEPTRADLLHRPLVQDVTQVMNVALVLGAFFAAGLAGRFAQDWRIGLRPLVAAVIGGLLLGYGARMALGCNVSAFFSGIASGSVHGWVWIAAAIPGNIVGVWLRPVFGLR